MLLAATASVYTNKLITHALTLALGGKTAPPPLTPPPCPCVSLYLLKTHTFFSFCGLDDLVEGKHDDKDFQWKESAGNNPPLFPFYLISPSIPHLSSPVCLLIVSQTILWPGSCSWFCKVVNTYYAVVGLSPKKCFKDYHWKHFSIWKCRKRHPSVIVLMTNWLLNICTSFTWSYPLKLIYHKRQIKLDFL